MVLGRDARLRHRTADDLRRAGCIVSTGRDDGRRIDAAVVAVGDVPPGTAADLVAEARAAGDSVVVVLDRPTAESVRELLDAGADAVVPADDIEARLQAAVAAVSAGMVAAPKELLRPIERPALTPREKQALAMVVLGFSNADIAAKLYVAESTVKSHLSSAFAKLGVRTRSQATALILDRSNGLGTGILAIVGDGDADTA